MQAKLPSAVMRTKARIEELETAPKTEEEVVETPTVVVEPEVKLEAAPAPTPAPPDRDAKYWEHRFKTLEGISKAESARDKETIRASQDKLNALEAQLVDIEKRIPRQFDLRKYLSEDEIDTLDERQLQAAIKIAVSQAEEGFDSRIKKHVEPLQQELQRAKESAHKTRTDAFWTTISTAVPNFKEINDSQEWLTWLGQEDPVSGAVRDDILQNAQGVLDGPRVVALFRAFLKEKEASSPVRKLERKVVPDTVPALPEIDPGSAHSMSRADIRKFYSDVAKGYYKGRQKDIDAMERKINAAQQANAIY